ncbi:MAG: thiol-disulfide oxidoreductase DCC family protein [Alteraurantiacibacter sp.]
MGDPSDLSSRQNPVIVFDGYCVLCSANARFVLRYDKRERFRLAAMQGETGAALLRQFGIDPDDPESFIIVQGDRALRDSDAVLALWSELGWPWKILAAATVIPRGWRDGAYRIIARNRYRLFGRREQCFVPDKRWADRIL